MSNKPLILTIGVISLNILLVDDEEFILDYLEESIQAMPLGINTIFKASSVDEALEIFNAYDIPIIITDIRMPEKTGLDFLEILSQQQKMAKTILLSSYSDFEFAKTAIQHGAVDYLLKPIMEDELEQVLQRVIHEINVEKKRRYELEATRGSLKIATSKMKEYLLLDLFHGKKYTDSELQEQISDYQLEIKLHERCVIITIQLETAIDGNQRTKEESDLFANAILNIMEELLFGDISNIANLWFCRDFNNFINFVIPLRVVNDDFNLALNKFNQFKTIVNDLFKTNLSILVSPPFDFNQDLHTHYLKVLNHFLKNIEDEGDSVHILDDSFLPSNYKTLTILNENPTLLYLMENNRWSEVTSKIDEVLDELDHETNYSNSQLIEVFYYLYSCFSYMSQKYGQENIELINSLTLFHNPFNLHSTDQIRDLAKSFISQFSQFGNKKDTENSFLISQVNTFIKQNMSKDVSLSTISDHVYLHPVYLSRMYKKETGENISAYILRLRMEKAATLLTTTNKRVSDIALEVGYQKPQYFINLFKETYQTTPQRYRNKFRNNV